MAKPRTDIEGDESSASEHTPASGTGTEDEEGTCEQSQSGDPAQDSLIGEISLDDRFNEDQLSRLVLSKDEYRQAGKKERGEIAFRMGDTFVKEMVRDGIDVSEDERVRVLEVFRPNLGAHMQIPDSY